VTWLDDVVYSEVECKIVFLKSDSDILKKLQSK
jgi:hypothetical protein